MNYLDSPSSALEEYIKKLLHDNKGLEFDRKTLLDKSMEELRRNDLNSNILSGVIHRMKLDGYIISKVRGKYLYNENYGKSDNEDYITAKSKSIVDKLILDFENDISKIDILQIKSENDIKKIKYLDRILKDLKDKRKKIDEI